jgi:hypothetical protein
LQYLEFDNITFLTKYKITVDICSSCNKWLMSFKVVCTLFRYFDTPICSYFIFLSVCQKWFVTSYFCIGNITKILSKTRLWYIKSCKSNVLAVLICSWSLRCQHWCIMLWSGVIWDAILEANTCYGNTMSCETFHLQGHLKCENDF